MPMRLPEDELVAAIRRVASGDAPGLLLGIGDDAAVVRAGTGDTVLTLDVLVEDVHFTRGSISAHDLGAKSVTVNVSDVAAMGASPRWVLLGLVLGPGATEGWVMELLGGMRQACDDHGASLVGGDLSRGETTVISVTLVGEVAPGRAVTRSGARVGDAVVVTGALGAAAAGLAITRLATHDAANVAARPWGRALLDAFLRPVARVEEASTLAAQGATAMMDLSDGLARDLPRLCAASGVGALVRRDDVPVSSALREGAATLGLDPIRTAILGGEDYEILATIPTERVAETAALVRERTGTTLTVIGRIVDGDGILLDSGEGTEPFPSGGWDHFGS